MRSCYCEFVKVNRPLSPVAEIQQSCRLTLLLCLLLFHEGVVLHLRHVSSAAWMHRGASRGLLRRRAAFLCYRPSLARSLSADTVAHNGLYVAPQKYSKPPGVTHTHWQAVVTGAPYCVSTLKVISVPKCAAEYTLDTLIWKPLRLV